MTYREPVKSRSNLDVNVKVEFVDHHLPDYPKDLRRFKDDEFDLKTSPLARLRCCKSCQGNETLQLDVVVDVIVKELKNLKKMRRTYVPKPILG